MGMAPYKNHLENEPILYVIILYIYGYAVSDVWGIASYKNHLKNMSVADFSGSICMYICMYLCIQGQRGSPKPIKKWA